MFDDAAWAVNSAVECYPHTVEVRGSNPLPPTITAEHSPPWSFYLKIEVPFNEIDFLHPTPIHLPIRKSWDGAGNGVVHAGTDGRFCAGVLARQCVAQWRSSQIERFVPQSPPFSPIYDPVVVVWWSGHAAGDYTWTRRRLAGLRRLVPSP